MDLHKLKCGVVLFKWENLGLKIIFAKLDYSQWDLFDQQIEERVCQYIRTLNLGGPKPHLWKICIAEFKYLYC